MINVTRIHEPDARDDLEITDGSCIIGMTKTMARELHAKLGQCLTDIDYERSVTNAANIHAALVAIAEDK